MKFHKRNVMDGIRWEAQGAEIQGAENRSLRRAQPSRISKEDILSSVLCALSSDI